MNIICAWLSTDSCRFRRCLMVEINHFKRVYIRMYIQRWFRADLSDRRLFISFILRTHPPLPLYPHLIRFRLTVELCANTSLELCWKRSLSGDYRVTALVTNLDCFRSRAVSSFGATITSISSSHMSWIELHKYLSIVQSLYVVLCAMCNISPKGDRKKKIYKYVYMKLICIHEISDFTIKTKILKLNANISCDMRINIYGIVLYVYIGHTLFVYRIYLII